MSDEQRVFVIERALMHFHGDLRQPADRERLAMQIVEDLARAEWPRRSGLLASMLGR